MIRIAGQIFEKGETMIHITFFDNGQTMAFENGHQVGKAQEPWILTFAEYLEGQGIDPTKQKMILPNGRRVKIIRQTMEGCPIFNYSVD
jgi:hypothetical protein